MNKYKDIFLENDLGAYLYNLRTTKGYTQEELEQKINMPTVTLKTIKRWEHDLEFPNLDQIYKISEVYEVPSEEIMQVKTRNFAKWSKRNKCRISTFNRIFIRNTNVWSNYF